MLNRDEEVTLVEFLSSLDHAAFRNLLFRSTGLDTSNLGDGAQSTETWAVSLTQMLRLDSKKLDSLAKYIVENYPSAPQSTAIRSICVRIESFLAPLTTASVRELDKKLNFIAQRFSSLNVESAPLLAECRSTQAFYTFFHIRPLDIEVFESDAEAAAFSELPVVLEQAILLRFGVVPSDSPKFILQDTLDDFGVWSKWVLANLPSWRNAPLEEFTSDFEARISDGSIVARIREIDDPNLTAARDKSLHVLSRLRDTHRTRSLETSRTFRALKDQKNPLRDVVMIGASYNIHNSPSGTTIILLEFHGKVRDVQFASMDYEVSIKNCVVEITAEEAYAGTPILGISPFGDVEPVTKNDGKIIVQWDGVKGDPSWRISSAEAAVLGWFEEEFCTLVGELFDTDKISLRIKRGDINVNSKRDDLDLDKHKAKVVENLIRRAVSEDADGVIVSEISLGN